MAAQDLAKADGKTLTGALPTNFGAELKTQVLRFQTSHGLPADGIAGTRTLMLLGNLSPKPRHAVAEGRAMSLILDALKRAERERKLGQAPTALEEVAVPPPATRQQPGRRPIILGVVAVAIAALAVFAFLRSRHPTAAAAAPAEPAFVEVTHEPTPAAPAAPATANPADEIQDARIEDGASIASLDDLTDGDASMPRPLRPLTRRPAACRLMTVRRW